MDIYNLVDRVAYNVTGISGGSLLSSVMSNIYFSAFDNFVESVLFLRYNRGKVRERNLKNAAVVRFTLKEKELLEEYPELIEPLKRAKYQRVLLQDQDIVNEAYEYAYRRLYYVRYLDAFIIGFSGPKQEALSIMRSMEEFLSTKLLFVINDKKSIIVHSSQGFNYLGTFICCAEQRKLHACTVRESVYIGGGTPASCKMRMLLPTKDLLERYIDRGLLVRRESDRRIARATADRRIATLPEKEIVQRYNTIIRGLVNYYSFINRRSDLWVVLALLRKSCALTLAFKLKLRSAARAFTKFGRYLRIVNLFGQEVARLDAYPTTLKTNIRFHNGGSEKADVAVQVLNPLSD